MILAIWPVYKEIADWYNLKYKVVAENRDGYSIQMKG